MNYDRRDTSKPTHAIKWNIYNVDITCGRMGENS